MVDSLFHVSAVLCMAEVINRERFLSCGLYKFTNYIKQQMIRKKKSPFALKKTTD